jgi:hypothetical protein
MVKHKKKSKDKAVHVLGGFFLSLSTKFKLFYEVIIPLCNYRLGYKLPVINPFKSDKSDC